MIAVALVALAFGEVIGARQRRGELAVLRALGASRNELRRLLAAEQTVVAGAAILVGAATGVALSPLLAPVLGAGGVADDAGVSTAMSAGAFADAGGLLAGIVVPAGAILTGVGLLLLAAALGALTRGRLAARADVAAVLRGEVR
jgi:ABC-type antimicrobial peptide transport system permease subunit